MRGYTRYTVNQKIRKLLEDGATDRVIPTIVGKVENSRDTFGAKAVLNFSD